jgi:hypothetical protein
VTSDMVALCASSRTILPPASQTKIIGALSSDMIVAEMVIEGLGIAVGLSAILPQTLVRDSRCWWWANKHGR